MGDQAEPQPDPVSPAGDFSALVERARRGDRDVLPQLRAVLDLQPELWQRFGDLAAHAEAAWVRLAAGADLGMAEAMKRKVAALKAELAGPKPSPLERLLVARITATWLQVHYADAAVAQAAPDTPIKQMDYALRRQAQAHRCHLQALGALTVVRRLLPSTSEAEPTHDVPISGSVVGAESDTSPLVKGTPSAEPETMMTANPENRPLVVFDPSRDDANAGNHSVRARQQCEPAQ